MKCWECLVWSLNECLFVCTTLFDSRNPSHSVSIQKLFICRLTCRCSSYLCRTTVYLTFDCYFCNLKSINFGFSVTSVDNWTYFFHKKRKIVSLTEHIQNFILNISMSRSIVCTPLLINSIYTLFYNYVTQCVSEDTNTLTKCRLINWPHKLVQKNDRI